jgi:hypothetical protein
LSFLNGITDAGFDDESSREGVHHPSRASSEGHHPCAISRCYCRASLISGARSVLFGAGCALDVERGGPDSPRRKNPKNIGPGGDRRTPSAGAVPPCLHMARSAANSPHATKEFFAVSCRLCPPLIPRTSARAPVPLGRTNVAGLTVDMPRPEPQPTHGLAYPPSSRATLVILAEFAPARPRSQRNFGTRLPIAIYSKALDKLSH